MYNDVHEILCYTYHLLFAVIVNALLGVYRLHYIVVKILVYFGICIVSFFLIRTHYFQTTGVRK